jgi:periplasmic protein CpxP/Spy
MEASKAIRRGAVMIAVLACALAPATVAFAAAGQAAPPQPPAERLARGAGQRGAMLRALIAADLDLTQEQKDQIGSLLAAQRASAQPIFAQLVQLRGQLRQAAQTEPFDEATVRALARQQGDLLAQLTVSRTQVRSQIYKLLAPAQQVRLKKLEQTLATSFRRPGTGNPAPAPVPAP